MQYGTDSHFAERSRAARRVSNIAAGVSGALLLAFATTWLPPVRTRLERINRSVRFGIAGDQEKFVRRIMLEPDRGPVLPHQTLGQVTSRAERRGGDRTRHVTRTPEAAPETRPNIEGPGDSFEDRLARAMARRSDVPVVLQDQLIIDRLVRPVYPDEARDRDIMGKVAVLALIDTTGTVVSADIVSPSGNLHLDQAALSAVWQCRFRPYRIEGKASEVYVVMPFNFTIY